ncbi:MULTISPECIES: hypothetical protein [Micromonospora]|uniref:hypothetical protein n=1 Tax=Micromonospora TaxID=1873 RepID=UPI001E2CB1E7|nr:hypothetical protein [Micromonospora sp. NBRC 110038]
MRLIGRLSFAMALGALGAAALTSLWHTEALLVASCEPETIGSCFSWRLPTIFVGPLVVTALVWLALRATGADRALPAALLGAIATAGAVGLYEAFQPRWTPPPGWLAACLGAAGFAVGVLLGVVRLPMAVQAGAAAVLLLVPTAAFPLLHKATRRAERAQAFAQLGVPLMVAEVDGYRVTAALTDRSDRRLSVWMAKGESSLSIVVVPLPGGFSPPAHCGPTIDDLYGDRPAGGPPAVLSCRAVGPDHWVRTEREDQVHLVRRNDALVYVDPGADVPVADVATAAAHLTEVTADRLAELAVR